MTEIPGTTRDLVSETIDLEGLRVTVVDTAGLRATDDRVESEGVSRATAAAANADLILFVVDLSTESSGSEEEILESHVTAVATKRVVVANKSDLPARRDRGDAIAVSALTGMGLDELRRAIGKALDIELMADRPDITNIRHIALVERADQSLGRARSAALADGRSMSEEFVLADLQDARVALEEVTGRRAPEDLLAHIFSRFCIGK